MTVGWACLECDEAGETSGSESGPAAKHVKANPSHATTTALTPAAALAIAGRVR